MCQFPHLLQFLVVAVAGWINQQQCDVIDYLQEENRRSSSWTLRGRSGPIERLASTSGSRPGGDSPFLDRSNWAGFERFWRIQRF